MTSSSSLLKRSLSVLLLGVTLIAVPAAKAEEPMAPERRIRVVARESVLVTTPKISLSDIADVDSRDIADDESIIALKKIVIDSSPAPGQTSTISANNVLERLRAAGVDTNRVGYSIPRVISVKRASRTLGIQEVLRAMELSLKASGRDAQIKNVNMEQDVNVIPGEVQIEALPLAGTRPGHISFDLKAKGSGQDEIRFRASAQVDEWREIPVATRGLDKGTVVNSSDVAMARMNISAIPRDAADGQTNIIGLSTSREIGPGEVFRRTTLSIPPLIEAGTPVLLLYRTKAMEATASGTALDAGAQGQQIRVRNDASKKIVRGTVLATGTVGVNQ